MLPIDPDIAALITERAEARGMTVITVEAPIMGTPIFNWPDDFPIEDAIGEAMGYASMCWDPSPEGVFDSERASDAQEELVAFLRRKQIGVL